MGGSKHVVNEDSVLAQVSQLLGVFLSSLGAVFKLGLLNARTVVLEQKNLAVL